METRITMCTLFQQLGMPSGTEDVEDFFENHRLRADVPLLEAPFWNEAQQQFLREVLETQENMKSRSMPHEQEELQAHGSAPQAAGSKAAACWIELVTELYARLRH